MMLLILMLPKSKAYGGKWPDPAIFPLFPKAALRNPLHPQVSRDFPHIPAYGPVFRSRLSFSKQWGFKVLTFSDDDRI